MIVVSDTSPLSGLAIADHLSLLQQLYGQVVIPAAVAEELKRGEAEAISLALELSADELLIDERLGRREAMRLGLSITGLLGVLLVAKRQGLLTTIRPVLDVLIAEAGFRVSNQLYIKVLIAAGEPCE